MRILTNKQEAIDIDDEDYAIIEGYTWYTDKNGYAVAHDEQHPSRKIVKMHRLLMNPGIGQEVDHKNGIPLDNRRSNLRLCSHSQNGKNKRSSKGSSRFKGVSLHKRINKWMASITMNYKKIHLGYFETEEQAAKSYDLKAKELFGEFANLNFPY